MDSKQPPTTNIFCDESCHLENDHQPIMLVGCIWTSKEQVKNLTLGLNKLKEKFQARGELKWQKVSASRMDFFLAVVDWFFSTESLHFRCVIVDDKSKLNHTAFNRGSHEAFYFKLYYQLLHRVLETTGRYEIYLDLKDTRGKLMLPDLRAILCRAKKDFEFDLIGRIQNVHSNEVALVQVADFLLGAVSYRNRGLKGNVAKEAIVKKIEDHYQKPLTRTSSLSESKLDIFIFQPRGNTER